MNENEKALSPVGVCPRCGHDPALIGIAFENWATCERCRVAWQWGHGNFSLPSPTPRSVLDRYEIVEPAHGMSDLAGSLPEARGRRRVRYRRPRTTTRPGPLTLRPYQEAAIESGAALRSRFRSGQRGALLVDGRRGTGKTVTLPLELAGRMRQAEPCLFSFISGGIDRARRPPTFRRASTPADRSVGIVQAGR